MRPLALGLALLGVLAVAGVHAGTETPKRGGILTSVLIEDPPGLLIHESATVSNVWPMMPCYSNLVLFDPQRPLESADTVIPELAAKWSWQDNYRSLVFFLRKDVRWHDGRPFTSRDVKYTFDVVREGPEAPAKLRLSARRDWYVNVEAIETPDPPVVVFRLKRPQPSLLLMLASGYSPVYPAHVPLGRPTSTLSRHRALPAEGVRPGPGGRARAEPRLLRPRPARSRRDPVPHHRGAGTRLAALQAGRLDAFVPLEMTRTMAETAKRAVPSLVIIEVGQNGSDNVILNHKRPPFDHLLVRRAISLAMDRDAYVRSVRQGGAVVGAALMPTPLGIWGLSEPDLRLLPGYGSRPGTGPRRSACWRRLASPAGPSISSS